MKILPLLQCRILRHKRSHFGNAYGIVIGTLVVGNGATYDSQYVKNISTTSQILGSKTVLTSATLSVTKNYINGTVSDVSLVTQTANVADYPGHNVNFITGVSSLGGLLTATSGIAYRGEKACTV